MMAGGVVGFRSRRIEVGLLPIHSVGRNLVAQLARRVLLVVLNRMARLVGTRFLGQIPALVVPEQPAKRGRAAPFDLAWVTKIVVSHRQIPSARQFSVALRFEIFSRDQLAEL